MCARKVARSKVVGSKKKVSNKSPRRLKKLKMARVSDLDDVWQTFRAHKELFPHVWKTKIRKKIKDRKVIYHDGVVITYLPYKRRSWVGDVLYEKGDIHLQQIVKHPDSKANASRILKSFIDMNEGKVVLSVRRDNRHARRFYKKNQMKEVGRISWSDGSLEGVVVESR